MRPDTQEQRIYTGDFQSKVEPKIHELPADKS